MPSVAIGLIAAAGSLLSSKMSSDAAGSAADAQSQASAAGIAEQRRQFDAIQKLLSPYVAAGEPALQQQQAFLGLQGPEAERAAIERISGGETFKALSAQGENAMLQNASATGGLRGGNIQGALAQYRPALLSSLIDQQYGRLGGLTSLGQQSAAGVGTAGQAMGVNVANLMGQQGAAQAAGAIGQAKAYGGAISGLSNIGGQYFGSQAFQNQNIANQYGTNPGSQQTAMLQQQNAGL
jgi:hypothetical protein